MDALIEKVRAGLRGENIRHFTDEELQLILEALELAEGL